MPPRTQQVSPTPPWYLAWGHSEQLSAGVTWRDNQLAIAHAQPAFSLKEQFLVVGDIWLSNRPQLLQRLGGDRISLPSTDSQIVAQLWERWGIESLSLLEGMYGLAIWDRERQQLWLVRDRTGCRTLYYTTTGSTRWVAPRLRTLTPYRSSDLNLVALRDYLCCAFVPGEQTLWLDVRELRPGTSLCLPDETVRVYWQPREEIRDTESPLEWHGQQLRSLLEQLVREYLPHGEPVGVFLSGGIDSSCITALAAKLHDRPVHTYSIHFGLEYPHELEFSNLVAQHYQTQHHILEITPATLWAQLPLAMAHLDDPIGEGLTVPNLLLGKLAKESVNVVLNGEGGDPCFGGPKNQPMLLNSLYSGVTAQSSSDALSAYLTSFKKCFQDLPSLLKPDIWNTVRAEPSVFAGDLNQFEVTYLNRLMLLNIKLKGADYILTKVSNYTQAAGIEGRSPLFDYRVVELSLQIPPEYKLSGATEKAVLKQAVADLLPDVILQRPKSGMVMHMQQWFRHLWQGQAQGLLLNKKAAIAPYLNQALLREWLNYRGDRWSRYGLKLWLLVTLEIWLQVNQE
ncbi:MAG TPA: asparagine synthase [Cyanobacteria bacterium UBA8803]|nr:asparagine synthase [Cyanobacteria bacterium UBA9273]HBL60816.1 asparagine synthase [Cyanobacteria bacterium UBA8803]